MVMKQVLVEKTFYVFFLIALGISLCIGFEQRGTAQPQDPVSVDSHIHVAVDLVQLNVAVTDSKGNYVTGLQPGDFTVMEDGIPQKIATFGEGNEPTRRLADVPPGEKDANGVQQIGSDTAFSTQVSTAELSSVAAGAN